MCTFVIVDRAGRDTGGCCVAAELQRKRVDAAHGEIGETLHAAVETFQATSIASRVRGCVTRGAVAATAVTSARHATTAVVD